MSLNKRIAYLALAFTLSAALHGVAADETEARLGRAATVLTELTATSRQAIQPAQIAKADCVVVIPGFKKGAALVGVGFGKGFISCRNGDTWSAPGAVTLESASLGAQIGGTEIDIVVLSLDKQLRPKLLSDRFTVGTDASAAWGNGKTACADPNARILFFGLTKGAFAGFGLAGATLKADDSGNRALYGKPITNLDIVEGHVDTPDVAQSLVARLSEETSH